MATKRFKVEGDFNDRYFDVETTGVWTWSPAGGVMTLEGTECFKGSYYLDITWMGKFGGKPPEAPYYFKKNVMDRVAVFDSSGYSIWLDELDYPAEEKLQDNKKKGTCPKCQHAGTWVRMALVCPTHGMFAGC